MKEIDKSEKYLGLTLCYGIFFIVLGIWPWIPIIIGFEPIASTKLNAHELNLATSKLFLIKIFAFTLLCFASSLGLFLKRKELKYLGLVTFVVSLSSLIIGIDPNTNITPVQTLLLIGNLICLCLYPYATSSHLTEFTSPKRRRRNSTLDYHSM